MIFYMLKRILNNNATTNYNTISMNLIQISMVYYVYGVQGPGVIEDDMPRNQTCSPGLEHGIEYLSAVSCKAVEQAEEFVRRVLERGWQVVHHHSLPDWLKDNDFLLRGHRPPTNSFLACFKSIFRIHTETGNIWTHLLGKLIYKRTSVNLLPCSIRSL